jgi:hypothetical protein
LEASLDRVRLDAEHLLLVDEDGAGEGREEPAGPGRRSLR